MTTNGGRILVICYGNLCRSPMAEGLLRARMGSEWDVRSAGTDAYSGDSPSPLGCEAIRRHHGIDITEQRSTALTVQELEAADHVFAMSAQQAKIAAALADVADRVRLFGSFAPALERIAGDADPGGTTASVFEVGDPMGGTLEEYSACLERLHQCTDKCAAWLENGAPADTGPPSVASPLWRFQAG